MATEEIPEWIAARGTWDGWFLPAAADLSAITVAEFSAGVRFTCFTPEPSWEGIGTDITKGEQTRACLQDAFEVVTDRKTTIADLSITVLPQGADTDPANAAATAMAEGESGVLVIRRGLLSTADIAVAQKYSAVGAKVDAVKEPIGGEAGAPTINVVTFSASGGKIPGSVAA